MTRYPTFDDYTLDEEAIRPLPRRPEQAVTGSSVLHLLLMLATVVGFTWMAWPYLFAYLWLSLFFFPIGPIVYLIVVVGVYWLLLLPFRLAQRK